MPALPSIRAVDSKKNKESNIQTDFFKIKSFSIRDTAETQGASLSKQIDSLSFPIKTTSLTELIQQEVCSEGEGVKEKKISKREYLYFLFLSVFLCLLRTICASLTLCDMLEEGQSGQGQVVRVSARLAHKEPPAFSIPLSSGSPSQRTCKQPLRSPTHFISPPLYEAAAFPRPCAALCCCPPRGGHL